MLTTIFGRKRIFFGRLDPHTFKEAYAHIPQSTVGDILNHGAHKLYLRSLQANIQLRLQVHDSILVEVPRVFLQNTLKLGHECLSMPITINGITHTIPVDAEVGLNWGKYSNDNPDGLTSKWEEIYS